MKDPLFSLEDIQVDKAKETYRKEDPQVYYPSTTEENDILESRQEEAWVQNLIEEEKINNWASGGWELKK